MDHAPSGSRKILIASVHEEHAKECESILGKFDIETATPTGLGIEDTDAWRAVQGAQDELWLSRLVTLALLLNLDVVAEKSYVHSHRLTNLSSAIRFDQPKDIRNLLESVVLAMHGLPVKDRGIVYGVRTVVVSPHIGNLAAHNHISGVIADDVQGESDLGFDSIVMRSGYKYTLAEADFTQRIVLGPRGRSLSSIALDLSTEAFRGDV